MRIAALFFIVFTLQVSGQLSSVEQRQVDSLQQVIQNSSDPVQKAKAYLYWDNYIYLSDPELDFQLNLKIDSICSFAFTRGNLDSIQERNLTEIHSSALNNLGIIYKEKGEIDKAVSFYERSLELAVRIGDKPAAASSLNNIGIIYKNQGDIIRAIQAYRRALQFHERNNDSLRMAQSLHNIGNIYQSQGDFEKAIEYYKKSLSCEKVMKNHGGVATSYNKIGSVFMNQNQLDSAEYYLIKSYSIRKDIQDKKGIPSSLNNLGYLHFKRKSWDTALHYFHEAYKLNKELDLASGKAIAQYNISLIYFEQADFLSALEYANKAEQAAGQAKLKSQLRDIAQIKYQIFKKQNKNQQALIEYEKYIQYRDEILNEENKKETIRQEFKYEYEKKSFKDSVKEAEKAKIKDAELAQHKAQNEERRIEIKQQRQRSYFLWGALALTLVFGGLMYNRFQKAKKQKSIISHQKTKVDDAYEQLDEKNNEIIDSINYAKRIQKAILPPNKLVEKAIPRGFVLYKPKDIVAGDFYWIEELEDRTLIAAADCTGHGVPGAMVSVVCNNALNRSVREFGLTEPGSILDKTREIVIQEFEKSEEEVKDGMDIALISLQKSAQSECERDASIPLSALSHTLHSHSILSYAGAHNPLWIIRNGATEVEEIKANKQPIGKFSIDEKFTTHKLEIKSGDRIYFFSDGFADQFGGEKGKKLKTRNFKKLLLSIQTDPIHVQKQKLDEAFENWRGDIEQLDDMCVIGVEV